MTTTPLPTSWVASMARICARGISPASGVSSSPYARSKSTLTAHRAANNCHRAADAPPPWPIGHLPQVGREMTVGALAGVSQPVSADLPARVPPDHARGLLRSRQGDRAGGAAREPPTG